MKEKKEINKIDDGFVFLVGVLEEKRPIGLRDAKIDIDMKWAEGMIGVAPVFDSLEAAKKYGNGKHQILLLGIDWTGGTTKNGELPKTKDSN